MREYSRLEVIAITLLSIYLIKFVYSIFRGIWTCFLGHSLGYGVKWRSGDNVWAVITGATDGIGLEFAKQLAQKGYSLMIISRNEDKLSIIAKNIKQQFINCKQIKTLAVDFNRTDIYDVIKEELDYLQDIDVLVNNVGTVYHITEYFLKIPKTFNESYFYVNMFSATKMLEIVLPKMVDKRRGIIINISSSASDQPIPLFATYAATKAYLTYLSEAVSVEYESKGVVIQSVLPNQVETKLSKNVRVPLLSVSAHDYASAAIKTVGIETCTYGHWKHKLIAYVSKIVISIIGLRYFLKLGLKSLQQYRTQYYIQNNLSDD